MTAVVLDEDHVLQLVRRALVAGDVRGIVPTPLDQLRGTIGIDDVIDITELNAGLLRKAVRTFRRLKGAVFFAERVILLDVHDSVPTQRWTEAHELSHNLLPWHRSNSYLDHEQTLSLDALEEQEAEANTGAGHLLFQDDVFFDRALSYRHGVAVPVRLAPAFAASITATMRYYVLHHTEPMALIAASQYVVNGYSRVLYTVASSAYRNRYGDARVLLPAKGLPVNSDASPTQVAEAVRRARYDKDRPVSQVEVAGQDINGEPATFELEIFHNGYRSFVVVQPRRRIQLGRRLHVASLETPSSDICQAQLPF